MTSMLSKWSEINDEGEKISRKPKRIKEERVRARVTIGIPAYKAHDHICDALASIQIQTFKDIKVIIAQDLPGEIYEYVKSRFPGLDITILPCKKNTGPGLARQRALDACETEWIVFLDADDVFISPLAIEDLYRGATASSNIIECQGAFYEELMEPVDDVRIMVKDHVSHPWMHGRMYNVEFLRQNHICFSDLRAMEDGEFNWKVRLAIGGKKKFINKIDKPIYLWRKGSEHSITRVKLNETDEYPQYTYDLGPWGTVEAAIRAIEYCRKYNPENPELNDFILDVMLGCYFTLVECDDKADIFVPLNFWNAKRFYYEVYENIAGDLPKQKIKDAFSTKNIARGHSLLGTIPKMSWYTFISAIKESKFDGQKELDKLRAELPKKAIENDKKTGVIG